MAKSFMIPILIRYSHVVFTLLNSIMKVEVYMKLLFICMTMSAMTFLNSASAEVTVGAGANNPANDPKTMEILNCIKAITNEISDLDKKIANMTKGYGVKCRHALRNLNEDRRQIARRILKTGDIDALAEEIALLASESGQKITEASVRKMAKDLIRTRGTEPTETRIEQAMITDGMK